jgi:hypothetical protein
VALFVGLTFNEGAIEIEVVVDSGELQQRFHLPEAEHGSFSSLKWQV